MEGSPGDPNQIWWVLYGGPKGDELREARWTPCKSGGDCVGAQGETNGGKPGAVFHVEFESRSRITLKPNQNPEGSGIVQRLCIIHYQQSRASQSQRQASVEMHVRSIQHHQTESSCPTTQHNTMGFHVLRESNHAIVIWVEVGRYA